MSKGQDVILNARVTVLISYINEFDSQNKIQTAFEDTDTRFSAETIKIGYLQNKEPFTLLDYQNNSQAYISPEIALKIDEKLDDGIAHSGEIRSIVSDLCSSTIAEPYDTTNLDACIILNIYK